MTNDDWHWPADGELPEKGERVICWTGDPFNHNKGVKKNVEIEIGTYAREKEWYLSGYITCNAPIAWMHLPKPPSILEKIERRKDNERDV